MAKQEWRFFSQLTMFQLGSATDDVLSSLYSRMTPIDVEEGYEVYAQVRNNRRRRAGLLSLNDNRLPRQARDPITHKHEQRERKRLAQT